ncbi:MAG: hypothetical protein U0521_18350 [Anaerolineae bacterium]
MRRTLFLILLLLAGCNLETSGVATPSPQPTIYVAPTPYRGPTAIVAPTLITQQGQSGQGVGVQSLVVTATPRNLLTPVPVQTLIANPQPPPTSQNFIEVLINNVAIPAWNILYTFLSEGLVTMWVFAGARGGVLAQVVCCLAPTVLVVGLVLRRLRVIRWRR